MHHWALGSIEKKLDRIADALEKIAAHHANPQWIVEPNPRYGIDIWEPVQNVVKAEPARGFPQPHNCPSCDNSDEYQEEK